MTTNEIAEKIGLGPKTLNNYIRQAVKEGWLKFEDPRERLDFELIPKVVRNLNELLDKRDKTITIETAKGTLFKQFQQEHGIAEGNSNVIALKIEAAPSLEGQQIKVISGQVVGKPKELVEISLDREED